MKRILIKNGKIVFPSEIKAGNIEIENGKIISLNTSFEDDKGELSIDAGGKYIFPGFIDIHTNGIAGFDLTNGVFDIKSGNFILDEITYINGLEEALMQYARKGVTSVYLTTLAAPVEQLKRVLGYVKKYKMAQKNSVYKKVLKGIFIEGTFMKQAEFRGAHNPEYFFEPSISLFNELQAVCDGEIKIVNVVPEWGRSALNLIEYLTENNIISAAGHTGATGNQYENAIKKGLRLAVHFLNGPTGSSGKSFDGGGAVETILRSSRMHLEMIVDGYHVDKAYVLDTIKRKGFEKIIAISDSMFAAELRGLKTFEVFGVKGKLGGDGEYLQIADRENSLFGSMLIMPVAFSNLLNWLTTRQEGIWNTIHEPLAFDDAILKVTDMCSGNSAKLLGIYDDKDAVGSIEIGKTADLIIADIARDERGYRFKTEKVFSNGQLIN